MEYSNRIVIDNRSTNENLPFDVIFMSLPDEPDTNEILTALRWDQNDTEAPSVDISSGCSIVGNVVTVNSFWQSDAYASLFRIQIVAQTLGGNTKEEANLICNVPY